MKRYPKIKYPSDSETDDLFSEGVIVIQEKYDGANFRFTYNFDEGEIEFGSKRTSGDDLHRDQFADPINHVENNVDTDVLKETVMELGEETTFFGEAMMPHTLSYDWEETPMFIGFDIWNGDKNEFIDPRESKSIFDDMGLSSARLIDTVSADEWDDYSIEVPDSEYASEQAEGIVFKNPVTNIYSKYVRPEFKEKAKMNFGASSKKGLSDTEKFVEEYVPPSRVRSVAYSIVEDGSNSVRELEMSMMEPTDTSPGLSNEVIRDMVGEEGHNVFINENYEVDLGEFRSLVASRSASVLRRMIDEKNRNKISS